MFFWDLRFLTPALGLGFSLLPGLQFLRSSRRQKLLLAALLAVVTVTVTASTGPWSIYPSAYPARGMLAGGAVVAGLAAGALVVRRSTSRSLAATVVVFEVALALIAGYGLERRYEAGRYAKGTWEVQGLNPRALYAWAHQVRHTRIGVGGTLRATYPLYGVDLSNVVEYVGHPGAHGNFSRVRGCREWVSRFNNGAYRYVVVGETPGVVMPETTWLSGQAGVSHVLNEGGVSVFHVGEALSPRKCST